jgi:hypothetical protein
MIIPTAIILTIAYLGYKISKSNKKIISNCVNKSAENDIFTTENDYNYYYADRSSATTTEDTHHSSHQQQDETIHTTNMFHDPYNSVFNDGQPNNKSM